MPNKYTTFEKKCQLMVPIYNDSKCRFYYLIISPKSTIKKFSSNWAVDYTSLLYYL